MVRLALLRTGRRGTGEALVPTMRLNRPFQLTGIVLGICMASCSSRQHVKLEHVLLSFLLQSTAAPVGGANSTHEYMQKCGRTFDVSCEALRHLLVGEGLGNVGVRGNPSLVVGDGLRLLNVWPCNNGSHVSPGCRRVPIP